jgi:translation initiation factor 1
VYIAIKETDICPTCSYPKELCICENIEVQEQQITIYNETRRWGKIVTIVNFDENTNIDLDNLLTKAKKKCASGGTVRDNKLELQGDHKFKLKKFLIKQGIPKENLIIKISSKRNKKR